MKLGKLILVVFIICNIMLLAGCANTHSGKKLYGDDRGARYAGYGMNGARTSGLGEGSNFDEEGGSRRMAKRTFYFDFDRSDIHQEDRPAILAHAGHLAGHPDSKIILEGHTDPRGSREYNIALGENRANAVSHLLKSKGVKPSQVRVVSYGAEKLAVPGRSEDDYRLDRRAIITESKN